MALSAAQVTYRRPPFGLMLSLWLCGLLLRAASLSLWAHGAQLWHPSDSDGADLIDALAQLHTDNHISVYTLLSVGAQALGAQGTTLRAASLGCDALGALCWLIWLRGRSAKAASIMMALWAASPLLVQTGTAAGPHGAFGMCTTLAFMALWPVWQQQRPSAGAQLWLLTSWAVLVCVHPLGLLAVAAMVLTAIAWPKASAEALSNTLNSTVGQAGRLALNIGPPAFLAAAVYMATRLLGHLYKSPESFDTHTAVSAASIAQTLGDAWGLGAADLSGAALHAWPASQLGGAGLTLLFAIAGVSHPIGRKLVCIAALYGVSLVAYHSAVPVFGGPTLVPAWLLLLAGGALGLSCARAGSVVRLSLACLLGWQLHVWLAHCPLLRLPI